VCSSDLRCEKKGDLRKSVDPTGRCETDIKINEKN